MYDQGKMSAVLRQIAQDPVNAPGLAAGLQKMVSQGMHPRARADGPGRAGATKIYRVTDPGPVANGATTGGQVVQWRFPGRVLAVYGQTANALLSEAVFMSTQILIGGEKSLITNGDANAFATYGALFGQTNNWFPLDVEVANGDSWTILWRNEGSGGPITPALFFSFLDYSAK